VFKLETHLWALAHGIVLRPLAFVAGQVSGLVQVVLFLRTGVRTSMPLLRLGFKGFR
jgi:hypothetical protein